MDTTLDARLRICARCGIDYAEAVDACEACGGPVVPFGADRSDLSGRLLADKYVLLERLGRGGMGEVYLAEQQNLGRRVAVKLLGLNRLDRTDALRRFYAEAQNTSQLTHPHNVKIHDFGHTEDGLVFIVMERVRGKPLSALEGPISPARAATIVSQMCSALAEAHELGLVHRDLKPDNVMLSEVDGEDFVRVLDYGIAKSLDAPVSLTDSSRLLGTPEFMSPEQASSSQVDERADIYSLGCILYALVAGRAPFLSDNPLNLIYKHQNEKPPSPRRFAPISKALERVILDCLSKRPDDRPATVIELRRRLRALDGGGEDAVRAHSEPADDGLGDTLSAPSGSAAGAVQSGGIARWSVAVAIVLAGVGTVVFWPTSDQPPAPVAEAAPAPGPIAEPIPPSEPPKQVVDVTPAVRYQAAQSVSQAWTGVGAALETAAPEGNGSAEADEPAPRAERESRSRREERPVIEGGEPDDDEALRRARDATRSLLELAPESP